MFNLKKNYIVQPSKQHIWNWNWKSNSVLEFCVSSKQQRVEFCSIPILQELELELQFCIPIPIPQTKQTLDIYTNAHFVYVYEKAQQLCSVPCTKLSELVHVPEMLVHNRPETLFSLPSLRFFFHYLFNFEFYLVLTDSS